MVESVNSDLFATRLTTLLCRKLSCSSTDEEEVGSQPLLAVSAFAQYVQNHQAGLYSWQNDIDMCANQSTKESEARDTLLYSTSVKRTETFFLTAQYSHPTCQPLGEKNGVESSVSEHSGEPAQELPRSSPVDRAHVSSVATMDDDFQQQQLEKILKEQAEEDERRLMAQAAREQEMQQFELAFSREHLAACRISRAWKRYVGSSIRRSRLAAAICIQSNWRALQLRKLTMKQIQADKALQQLHLASLSGDYTKLKDLVNEVTLLGHGVAAQQQLAAFEESASRTADEMYRAAQSGTLEEYQRALQAVQRFSHLSQLAEAAHKSYLARKLASEEALEKAAQESSMYEFHKMAAAAAILGVSQDKLEHAKNGFLARCKRASQRLTAAVESRTLDFLAYKEGCVNAQNLGLLDEVARAERKLVTRSEDLKRKLPVLAKTGSSMDIQVAAQEARALGLPDAAAAALEGLKLRREQALKQLRQSSACGSKQDFQEALREAEVLEVDRRAWCACSEEFTQRSKAVTEQLERDAEAGSVQEFCKSRDAALRLGIHDAVSHAVQLLQQRRQRTAAKLAASARSVCQLAQHIVECYGAGTSSCSLSTIGTETVAVHVLESHLNAIRELQVAVRQPKNVVFSCWQGKASLDTTGVEPVGYSESVPDGTQLALDIFHGMPSALQQHAVDGKQCSMLDAALLFACCAMDAGKLQLQKQLQAAYGAMHLQFEVAISKCSAPCFPLSSKVAFKPTPSNDIMLQQVRHLQLLSSIRCIPAWKVGAALQHGYQLWRNAQQARSACYAAADPHVRKDQQQLRLLLVSNSKKSRQLSGKASDGSPATVLDIQLQAGGSGSKLGCSSRDAGVGKEAFADACLDVSMQGLQSLDLLTSCTSLRSLIAGTNFLRSLHDLAGLTHLQELLVSDNQLESLEGLQALSMLTRLDANDNMLQDLTPLSRLISLQSLSLQNNELQSGERMLQLQLCCRLTHLQLGGNQLADLSPLVPLSRLVTLDISSNRLSSLQGLGASCPLLQTLIASGNQLEAFPTDLHLPFLRDLWLSCCSMAAVPQWPWLPSLQSLHLQENTLRGLPPMHTLVSLERLNLSFNHFDNAQSLLNCLVPLATMTCLHLSNNPCVGAMPTVHYRRRILDALPGLHELDLDRISQKQRQQRRLSSWQPEQLSPIQMLRSTPPQCFGPAAGGRTLGAASSAVTSACWQGWNFVRTGLQYWHWCRAPAALPASAFLTGARQQQQLLRNFQAASTAVFRVEDMWKGWVSLASLPPLKDSTAFCTADMLSHLHAMMLMADQDLLVINPVHYAQLVNGASRATLAIQSHWRGFAARRACRKLAAKRLFDWSQAAAARIQAVWRGIIVRQRNQCLIEHLKGWREEWRRGQAVLLLHHQQRAAAFIQAAWRGRWVRTMLRRARAAVSTSQLCSPSTSFISELSEPSSLADLFRGAEEALMGPERLSLDNSHTVDDDLCNETVHQYPLTTWLDKTVIKRSISEVAVLRRESLSRDRPPCPLGATSMQHIAREGSPEAQAGGNACPRQASSSKLPVMLQTDSRGMLGHREGQYQLARPGEAGDVNGAESQPPPCLRLPPLQPSPPTPQIHLDSLRQEWGFKADATAAAFMQMRRRQEQLARQRATRQQLKDPIARLRHFKRNNQGLPNGAHHIAHSRNTRMERAQRTAARGGSLAQFSNVSANGISGNSEASILPADQAADCQKDNVLNRKVPNAGSSCKRRPVLLQSLFPFQCG